jgi:thymidylate synthase (FAD)
MSVKLVSATPNIEETMVYVARVSSPKSQSEGSNPGKLLKYCLDNKHWSVFEHGFITLEINTSRTIARQILRHRSFSFSEFSQRYSEVTEKPILTIARRQDTKNRQNSIDDMSYDMKSDWELTQHHIWDTAYLNYKNALSMGVAKEIARSLLPEGMTPSRMYVSGSVRSWITYLDVRCGNGTQLEHVEIAKECKEVLRTVLPFIFEAKNW